MGEAIPSSPLQLTTQADAANLSPPTCSLFATTFISSFIKYSTKTYDAFATSNFARHSALTTANIVYNVTSLATYPIMAKLSNVSAFPSLLTVI